jgi:hypothetical protein
MKIFILMNAERYKEATKVVLKCSYFMFWLNWANTCKHFFWLFPYLFLFFFTPTLANIYSTGPTLANFGARQQTSPNPKPCCSELYYAPTRALEDWRNGPHGGARRPSRRHQPAGFLHGRTQDLHWRRDFGRLQLVQRFTSLLQISSSNCGGSSPPRATRGEPGGCSELGVLARTASLILLPPMPSMISLGLRYVWPFLIWLFK